MGRRGDRKTDGIMPRAWIIAGLFLAAFLLIQLFGPEKNLGERDTSDDFIPVSGIPDTLAVIFTHSCYDCHSNRTEYPWYGNLAPSSWLMDNHVREGKSHLNFSSWGILDRAERISQLNRICEECTDGSMPLRSYLLMHRTAGLRPAEIEAICEWAEQASMNLLTTKE